MECRYDSLHCTLTEALSRMRALFVSIRDLANDDDDMTFYIADLAALGEELTDDQLAALRKPGEVEQEDARSEQIHF